MEMDCEQLPTHVELYIANRRILGLPDLCQGELRALCAVEPTTRPTLIPKWQALKASQALQESKEEENMQMREYVKVKRARCD